MGPVVTQRFLLDSGRQPHGNYANYRGLQLNSGHVIFPYGWPPDAFLAVWPIQRAHAQGAQQSQPPPEAPQPPSRCGFQALGLATQVPFFRNDSDLLSFKAGGPFLSSRLDSLLMQRCSFAAGCSLAWPLASLPM